MSEENETGPYVATLKAGKGYEVPWVVIRADTLEQLESRVAAYAESGISATIGRAAKALEAGYTMGSRLGATSDNKAVEPETEEAPKKKAPTKKAAPKAGEQETEEAPEKEAPKATPKKAAAPKRAGGPPKPAWAN